VPVLAVWLRLMQNATWIISSNLLQGSRAWCQRISPVKKRTRQAE
jgi:hypothetical protein